MSFGHFLYDLSFSLENPFITILSKKSFFDVLINDVSRFQILLRFTKERNNDKVVHMSINTDPKKIEEILSRGVEEVINLDDLKKKMSSGEQLRVKLGIDPTSPSLHLGRSIPLLKLRDFQEMGHKAVFIIGDFTGVIGDTSDKDAERPMLDMKTIKKNLKTYKEQVAKIIDIKKAEFYPNSKWLKKLTFTDINELANVFSVNSFIQRDNIRRRITTGKRVSLREVLYPIMQGYDSVKVKADVEIGGMDQKFNLLAGRDLQKHFEQEEQNIVMGPLVEGTDGRKMSSSWGNTINIFDGPNDMFGKVMAIRDVLVMKYFTLLTRVPLEGIEEYKKKFESNPKDVKKKLAWEIVNMYHGGDAATKAEASWEETFSKGGVPAEAKKVKVKLKMPLYELLEKQGMVKSKTEFRRLIESGAIKIKVKEEERKVVDPNSLIEESGALKVGKKRFLKIEVTKN